LKPRGFENNLKVKKAKSLFSVEDRRDNMEDMI